MENQLNSTYSHPKQGGKLGGPIEIITNDSKPSIRPTAPKVLKSGFPINGAGSARTMTSSKPSGILAAKTKTDASKAAASRMLSG